LLINNTSSFIDHLYSCYFLYAHTKKRKLASSEGRHGADAISLSLSLSVMFSFDCYTHTYIRTREREEKKNDEAKQFDVCMRVYVCARSLQFKPDGVYVLFFFLILVRANTNRRRLSAMYKPFIILAPVQQQLNAFFFSFFFCVELKW
jgi:hypothetical protein